MKTETVPKRCQTCLYMATHEKCDHCLTEAGDYDNFNAESGWKRPEYKYLHWKEGNWLGRVMFLELTGRRSIVIGGQGEAEVNAKADPNTEAKNLHYVAEQCGYVTGSLTKEKKDGTRSLFISTSEGYFRLVWDAEGLKVIERWVYEYDWDADKDASRFVRNSWSREDIQKTLATMDEAGGIMAEYKTGL
jgi:hypothetical protein